MTVAVVMGVSGSGKTTVADGVARRNGWRLVEGDKLHPPANVAKMKSGTPLTDADRWPWLDRIAAEMSAVLARGDHAVLACSALKQAYRDRLARAGDVRFVFLDGDYATIAARLAARTHEYMPPGLLDSQFAALERPTDALAVDIRLPVPDQVAAIRTGFSLATTP